MNESTGRQPSKSTGSSWGWASGAWFGIALGIGVALGIALDNLALWMSLGLIFGIVFSGAAKQKTDARERASGDEQTSPGGAPGDGS